MGNQRLSGVQHRHPTIYKAEHVQNVSSHFWISCRLKKRTTFWRYMHIVEYVCTPDPYKKYLHLTYFLMLSENNHWCWVIHYSWSPLLVFEPNKGRTKIPIWNRTDPCCILVWKPLYLVLSHLINAEFFLPLQEKRANNEVRYDNYVHTPLIDPSGIRVERLLAMKRRRGCSQRISLELHRWNPRWCGF